MSQDPEIASEASRLVRVWAGPRLLGDSSKSLIRRAARRLGFTYSRTRALFYREAVVRADEMDTLRQRGKAVDANLDIVLARLEHVERRIAALASVQAGDGLPADHARLGLQSDRRPAK